MTGHRSHPKNRSTPCQKGSVLLYFIVTFIMVGDEWLSTAMSAGVRQDDRPMLLSVGTVTSPARRNPKNPKQQAAQSIFMSTLSGIGGNSTNS